MQKKKKSLNTDLAPLSTLLNAVRAVLLGVCLLKTRTSTPP